MPRPPRARPGPRPGACWPAPGGRHAGVRAGQPARHAVVRRRRGRPPGRPGGRLAGRNRSARQVAEVSEALGGRPVIAGLETVRGVADAREVLRPPVAGCYFGAEDYVADLGGARTAGNAEVAWARATWPWPPGWPGSPWTWSRSTSATPSGSRPRPGGPGARLRRQAVHPPGAGRPRPRGVPPGPGGGGLGRRVLDAFEAAGGDTIAVEGEMVDEVVAARAGRPVPPRPT